MAAVESIAAGAGSAGDKEAQFKALFDAESAKFLSSGDSAALTTLTALGQHCALRRVGVVVPAVLTPLSASCTLSHPRCHSDRRKLSDFSPSKYTRH